MRITLKDVAREAGTSTASVSATLSGNVSGSVRVSAETKQRIIDAAARLGYEPNPIARSLSTGRSGVLGLVFPYVDAFVDRNPFCATVMNGVFSEAIRDSFNMMLYTVRDGFWTSRHRIDPRVDGLIIVLPAQDDTLLHRCMELEFPCVAVVSAHRNEKLMTVNADDFEGGLIATRHLLDLGHERIALLHGGDSISTNAPRCQGYRAAFREKGLPVPEDLIEEAGFDWRPGFTAMNRLLDRPRREWPTAVFAINDLCAAGAIRALKARGVALPDEMAVVGFDDTWFAATTQPALTSVRMPIREMGALAARMLAAEVGGQTPPLRNPVLGVSLTVRGSCGSRTESIVPDFTES